MKAADLNITESDIRLALRDCYDPTLPCNIIDLGLVRAIAINPDLDAPGSNIRGVPQKHLVQITLTLTNPTEASEAQVSVQIANRLAGLQSVNQTNITFDHNPPWNPQQITPEGRRTLGLEGNPALVQIR